MPIKKPWVLLLVSVGIVFLGARALLSVLLIDSALTQNSTTQTVAQSSESDLEEYKSQHGTITFEDLARDIENHTGKQYVFTGEVIQVQESGNSCILRVNITKEDYGYKDTIWVNYTLKSGEKHILENDIITLWGKVAGRREYEAIFGNKITLPEINASIIKLQEV